MVLFTMDSEESSPITPATSIIPPSTPPNNPISNMTEHNINLHNLEPDDSPLLNSLQLSPREQLYLDEIISGPCTPHPPSVSVPAYKFPSLREHFTSNNNNSPNSPHSKHPKHNSSYNYSPTTSRSMTPSAEFLSRENSIKLSTVPKGELSRDKTIRYSVHIETDDFEPLNPPYQRRHKWFKGHGKTNSQFQQPNMGFLRNHKKSKSDY